jgi:hypothetical protein
VLKLLEKFVEEYFYLNPIREEVTMCLFIGIGILQYWGTGHFLCCSGFSLSKILEPVAVLNIFTKPC